MAVKVVLAAPAGTVTEAGRVTDALSLESVTAAPAAGAAAVSVTVQVLDPGVATVAGLQLSVFRLGRRIVTIPFVPAMETDWASAVVPSSPVSVITEFWLTAVGEMVNTAVATVPLSMPV